MNPPNGPAKKKKGKGQKAPAQGNTTGTAASGTAKKKDTNTSGGKGKGKSKAVATPNQLQINATGAVAGPSTAPPIPSSVCILFQQQGRCRFGAQCKFRHERSGGPSTPNTSGAVLRRPFVPTVPANPGNSSSVPITNNLGSGGPQHNLPQSQGGGRPHNRRVRGSDGDRNQPAVLDRKVRDLARMMTHTTPFSATQAGHFLALANEVLDSDLPAFKQKLIQELASEAGLRQVVGFVEATYQSNNNANPMTFWDHCVPFLKIISHEDVCSSLLLESQVGTIYNIIYGHSSSRAVPFLRSTVHHLTSTDTNIRQSAEFGDALCALSRALWMTLKVNQSASVQTEFADIAKDLRLCLQASGLGYAVRVADMDLRKVEQKLNIAEAIPLAQAPPSAPPPTQAPLTYQVDVDYPGHRSRYGPRHDNDSASIVDIRILPTPAEVMCMTRTEYLPMRDYHATAHHLPAGIERVLDTQFRLLREDTSGQLRDAVRFLFDSLAKNPTGDPNKIQSSGAQTVIYKNVILETFSINDKDGLLLTVTFDQPARFANKKVNASERRRWWSQSRFMQVGSLICLVDQNKEFAFFIVSERKVGGEGNSSNRAQDLSSHPTRALITLKFVDRRKDLETIVDEYHRHARYYDGYPLPYLVEFPGLLFASFAPILKFLQDIVNVAGGSVPFSRFLAPEGNKDKDHPVADPTKNGVIKVPPPAYMSQELAGGTLDLSVIMNTKKPKRGQLTHSITKPCSIAALQAVTSLDHGQCEALLGGLSRELALIQGPPGTGKSYVGVQIVKVLLHNRSKLKLGPIICVCYTNHALDQFLVDLLGHGVKKIVRIGSRSQAPELEQFTLRNVAQTVDTTFIERQTVRERRAEIQLLQVQVRNQCSRLGRVHHWTVLRNHLEMKYPVIHRQLFRGDQPDAEGFITVGNRKPENAIDDWVNLRYLPQIPGMKSSRRRHRHPKTRAQLMKCQDMSILSQAERVQLKQYWEDEIKSSLVTELKHAMAKFEMSKQELEKSYQERDRRCLQQAEIVGVTTTGLAGHAELLRSVTAKVLICEEAGEVLEAHSLAALLPSVQHAILIGDHQQLRPHIANYNLSMESKQGERYALDESLFERLIRQTYGTDGTLRFPFATLDTQRRMHPSISDLVRQTLYSQLKDHPSVKEYPEVEGMARRLFWLNHSEPENNADNSDPTALSKSNQFEIEMVAALVKHLIKQGCYGKGDIAVITPYLGQLMKLRRKLENVFTIVLGEKDQEEVELAGIAENLRADTGNAAGPEKATADPNPKKEADVRKHNSKNQLRLATVDNFQGEEAKVIVISLVRCNSARRCGFLKTSNRVNVLLSRARHGMYIIGNADTARPVQMWSDVLTLLSRDGNIGETLELRCPRHEGKQIVVQKPEDFHLYAPEGGCEILCGKRLNDCGHTCPDKCHSEALHRAVICQKKCARKLPGCEHPCRTICGKPCEICMVNIPKVFLPCAHFCSDVACHRAQSPDKINCLTVVLKQVPGCGHTVEEPCHVDVTDPDYKCITPCELFLKCGHKATNIPCHKARTPDLLVCGKSVRKTVPGCGHKRSVACHLDVASPDFKCTSICNEKLVCGHICKASCFECQNESQSTGNNHVPCRSLCGHSLGLCGHSCIKTCHYGVACGPCDQPCEFGCSHFNCSKTCTEPCTPCARACDLSCIHRGIRCQMPCAVPCDMLPCDKRCVLPLMCGHQCPSLCGERCPSVEFCQECASPSIRSRVVDTFRLTTYEDTNLDINPVIFPRCGHFWTMQVMDNLMCMRKVFEYEDDSIINFRQRAQREWIRDIKRTQTHCSECQRPISGISRYNRISKGVRMVALTRRLVGESTQEFLILEEQATEVVIKDLEDTRGKFSEDVDAVLTADTAAVIGEIAIDQLQPLITQRHKDIHLLAQRIHAFIVSTIAQEQPHFLLHAAVRESIRRKLHATPEAPFANIDESSVNPRSRLLGQLLYLQLEWARVLDIFKVAELDALKERESHIRRLANSIVILMPRLKANCKQLEGESMMATQPRLYVEAKLLHARFVGLELALPPLSLRLIMRENQTPHQQVRDLAHAEPMQQLMRNQEITSLHEALEVCKQYPIPTRGLQGLVEQALQIIPTELVLSQSVVTIEQMMLSARLRNHEGWTESDHWNFCTNRHPFTVEEARILGSVGTCPQCEAPVAEEAQPEAPREEIGTSELGANLPSLFGRLEV